MAVLCSFIIALDYREKAWQHSCTDVFFFPFFFCDSGDAMVVSLLSY